MNEPNQSTAHAGRVAEHLWRRDTSWHNRSKDKIQERLGEINGEGAFKRVREIVSVLLYSRNEQALQAVLDANAEWGHSSPGAHLPVSTQLDEAFSDALSELRSDKPTHSKMPPALLNKVPFDAKGPFLRESLEWLLDRFDEAGLVAFAGHRRACTYGHQWLLATATGNKWKLLPDAVFVDEKVFDALYKILFTENLAAEDGQAVAQVLGAALHFFVAASDSSEGFELSFGAEDALAHCVNTAMYRAGIEPLEPPAITGATPAGVSDPTP